MGLDATVKCNCYRDGKVNNPPPYPELVKMDTDGSVYISTDDDKKYFEFEKWKKTACEHEDMVLIHCRLGNISTIANAKSEIESIANNKGRSFSILLNKVVYSGSHAGDHLEIPDIKTLKSELIYLIAEFEKENHFDQLTMRVLNDLFNLCEKAMTVENPIAF